MIDSRQVSAPAMDRPTAAGAVSEPATPPATAGELIPRVSALRYQADTVNGDVVQLARDVYVLNLGERTTERERQSVRSLLQILADQGFSWSMMSRTLGISVPAIRKWRLGEGASPQNRHAVARLVALVDMLSDQFMIEDPAAWLEIPLAATRRTLADVFASGRVELVLEYAGRWIVSPEQVLDGFDSDWRATEAAREFETFVAADGDLGIRRIESR
jgi:hypothetical protein